MRTTNIRSKAGKIILAIDTSCDETSVAVLRNRSILSNVISSQVELHKKWGGVVPDIARRAHAENIDLVTKEAIKRAKVSIDDIDAIAVTYGPGLAIALEVGIEYAKNLALTNNKVFIPVNHMEGHLLSGLALNSKNEGPVIDADLKLNAKESIFPAVGILLSGSHTDLVLIYDIGKYIVVGETLDDAAGEAFDKVSRMMNLGYPGGPVLTYLARKAKEKKLTVQQKQQWREDFDIPVPMIKSNDLNFSFSGLKTSCLYKIKALRESGKKDSEWSNEFARAFICAVKKSILFKLEKMLDMCKTGKIWELESVIMKQPYIESLGIKFGSAIPTPKSVLIGGGVVNNTFIVNGLSAFCRKAGLRLITPASKLRSDNAAMIGVAAYFKAYYSPERQKMFDANEKAQRELISSVDRDPQLAFDTEKI